MNSRGSTPVDAKFSHPLSMKKTPDCRFTGFLAGLPPPPARFKRKSSGYY
ncbi:hypothetical protein SB48_HM08orf05883 [Heyndrickxia coagulans]|uniref:Uncharacterized protein n=1 Tax=Heyndrickxia coagulans TaxID=1398 RepID=A0AAN0T7Z3_HEYCO|nr:hypothetical protein SB48_HM08orf05883 [Heyndrickxia coagulans]